MDLRNLKRRLPITRPARPETNSIVENGAIGGAPPRLFPTNVANIFTQLPTGNIGASGIAPRIAARPNSAPMLDSTNYFTQIPGVGRLLGGLPTQTFKRGTPNVHPAAVSDAEHIRGTRSGGVHPTVRRKVLMGDKSL